MTDPDYQRLRREIGLLIGRTESPAPFPFEGTNPTRCEHTDGPQCRTCGLPQPPRGEIVRGVEKMNSFEPS